MHAPLGTPEREAACHDYIKALNDCHAAGFFARFGKCNDLKIEMNKCLRQERLDRTERNRLSSKEMQAKKQKVWEALDSDLDGSPSPPASSSSSTLSSTASPSLSATALNGVEEKVSGGWGWGNGMSGNGGEKRI